MLKMTLRTTGKPLGGGANAVENAVEAFLDKAGDTMVEAVKRGLGQADLYELSDGYRERKLAGKTKPAMRRVAGKANDQPLILSGDMYEGVVKRRDGATGEVVEVASGAGVSESGFDYAEYWETGEGSSRGFKGVDFLGKGFDAVEGDLEEMLADEIVRGLNL